MAFLQENTVCQVLLECNMEITNLPKNLRGYNFFKYDGVSYPNKDLITMKIKSATNFFNTQL